MGVWKLVDHPGNWKTIKCRWTYILKADGRYKVRLVAKGYTQVQGIDYEETFSPVARYESIWYLLANAALLNWGIEAMDVKLEYLHRVLNKEIYMEQPEGFIAKGEKKTKCANSYDPSMDWNKQDECGIGPLHTQLKRNWASQLYTLMQVYMFYIVTIKGGIQIRIWSSFYMSMIYYSWEKTFPRSKTLNVNLANCIKWKTSDPPHPIWGFELPETKTPKPSGSINRRTSKMHWRGSNFKMQMTLKPPPSRNSLGEIWGTSCLRHQDILPTDNWDSDICHYRHKTWYHICSNKIITIQQ